MSYFKMLTGEVKEIKHVADALGVNFEKKNGTVQHDNRTLIFDQNENLTHEFKGSFVDWNELFYLNCREEIISDQFDIGVDILFNYNNM